VHVCVYGFKQKLASGKMAWPQELSDVQLDPNLLGDWGESWE